MPKVKTTTTKTTITPKYITLHSSGFASKETRKRRNFSDVFGQDNEIEGELSDNEKVLFN